MASQLFDAPLSRLSTFYRILTRANLSSESLKRPHRGSMTRILALTKYDTLAAGTRQRFMQYEPALAAAGMEVVYRPLLDNDHLKRLVGGQSRARMRTAGAYLERIFDLVVRRDFDLLWVHLELFPYLPAVFELLAKLPNKPILYDFDDAIFHMYDGSSRPFVRGLLGGKLEPLLKSASACCCGNAYLLEYASRFCENSIILPTVVNTELYKPLPVPSGHALVVGWIGSPSTWPYLKPLLPLLEQLSREYSFCVRIVGAGTRAEIEAAAFQCLEFVEWQQETEIAEVQSMHIGIMPLPDDSWARGKSGYKLIQYMACGLPVVASPVGVNKEIVGPANGYLADTIDDWRAALVSLLDDGGLRSRMGQAGRLRVEGDFSLAVHSSRLVKLIKGMAPGVPPSTSSAALAVSLDDE